jgi:5'-nucleotidase / UDP-sugar diphosphatase
VHAPTTARWSAARRLLVALAATALALAVLPPAPSIAQSDEGGSEVEPDGRLRDGIDLTRLSGPGRIETAVEVSRSAFPAGGTPEVVLARADVYADALAGAPLATALDSPILLTPSDRVPQIVLDELTRLGADGVVVLGGAAAVSDAALTQLDEAGFATRRVSGATRFETAADIAAELVDGATGGTVYVVEGIDADQVNRGWPDAVAVAPLAAFTGSPVLLVDTDEAPAATLEALAALAPRAIIVVGGAAAVSDATADALVDDPEADDAPSLARIAGPTRYDTAAAVYDASLAAGMSPEVRWLATGRNFPDTLAAGPAVARLGDTLLLVDGADLAGSPATADRLSLMPEVLQRAFVVGGPAAISEQAVAQAEDLVVPDPVEAAFCLTVLHNNDGESALLGAGSGLDDYGSIGRFGSVVAREQAYAARDLDDGCETRGTLTVTSGDNFLAGPEFNASLARNAETGEPYFDSIALDAIGYDALALGNHDFDFGPEVTAELIRGFGEDGPPFLSANLDFSAEPELAELVDAGRIAASTIVETGGRQIGVIGAVTPILATISSPRNVVVDQDVAGAIAGEVDLLTADGADIIVLVSHLQGFAADLALIPELSGVDIVVAGGGDEILGRPGLLFVPGDESEILDTYPFRVEDADGLAVPVVTTAGDYKYLGRLVTRFDDDGTLLPGDLGVDALRSRMVRVADATLPDGVEKDAFLVENVEAPVEAFVADLAEDIIGETTVTLDGARPQIRQRETNLGNLMSDALRRAVLDRGGEFGVDLTDEVVGLQNGGGIRDSIVAGDISVLDTFAVAPFSNFVSAVEDVDAALLKLLLENAYSNVEGVDGRFAHLSNLVVEVDLSGTPQAREVNEDGSVTVTEPGARVVSATLPDGTALIADGSPVDGAPTITIATNDFTARGGDGYPFGDAAFTTVGITYQQATQRLVEALAADGPIGGAGTPYAADVNERIFFVE